MLGSRRCLGPSSRDTGRQSHVVAYSPDVRLEAGALRGHVDVLEEEGSDCLAVYRLLVRGNKGALEQGVVGLWVQLMLERHRIGDDDGGGQPQVIASPHGRDYLFWL